MENIQNNPERPAERLFRSLVFPNGLKKPGPKSTKLIIDGKDYTFKSYLPGKKSFSYQCILRAPVCKFLIYIPLENNYDEALELIDQDQINGIFTLNEHSQLCNEKYHKKRENEANFMVIEHYESDLNILE